MSNLDIAKRIEHFITTNFYLANPASLAPQASLSEQGVVDSTGSLEVVSFLEMTFGIVVHDSEVLPENLDSLDGLVRFVERKLSNGPGLRLVPRAPSLATPAAPDQAPPALEDGDSS